MIYNPPTIRPAAWRTGGEVTELGVTLNDATVGLLLAALAGLDPDADLIDRMAEVLADESGGTFAHLVTEDQDDFRRSARAVLAVVRESEAGA